MVALRQASPNGQVGQVKAHPQSLDPAGTAPPRGNWFARHPAWPLSVLLVGWPVWWLLGIETRMFILMAIPAVGG